MEAAAQIVRALLGIAAMFLIIATFQSSNNIAVAAALEAFNVDAPPWLAVTILVLVNLMVIIFLYSSRRLYGVIETAMTDRMLGTEAGRQHALARHPIGRLGQPEDVAYGVLYLASDESSFVTGSELVIDGGWTAQ